MYGIRILGKGRWLYFRQEWESVTLLFPDDDEPAEVRVTGSFWLGSPELRSRRIREFLHRNGLLPWPKGRPPHFDLEPLDGRFSLRWLEHIERQPALRLL